MATINTSIGNKYDKSGGVITGDVTINTQLLLKGGANFVTVKANSGTSNYTMTLPTTAGTNGFVLRTDGSGVLSWVDPTTIASGSGTVDSNSITDGSIVDADINATANIAQSKIAGLTTSLSGKENTITAGTTAQYYRGDKSWQTLNGATVANTPAGSIAATNVQSALNELDSEKQTSITASTNIITGSVATSLQNGVNINPFNTAAGNTGELRFCEL